MNETARTCARPGDCRRARLLANVALLSLLALFTSSCSLLRITPKSPSSQSLAPAPYLDEKTGIYFPGAMGGLPRRSVAQLEDRSPGLGLALSYRNSDAKLDLFVFDLKAPLVPTGIESAIVQNSFDDALTNIQKAASRGLYSKLNIQKSDTTIIERHPFLRARMDYGEKMIQKEGLLLVSGVNGQILKLRLTQSRPDQSLETAILQHLGDALSESWGRGYGGIAPADFSNLQDALSQIELGDGIDQSEAIVLAQRELITQQRHHRFDPRAPKNVERDADAFTMTFPTYEEVAKQPVPILRCRVSRRLPVRIDFEAAGDRQPSS